MKIDQILETASQVFLNKKNHLKLALIGILSRGHILIEDTPGVGKTTLVYLLAKLLGVKINRIQFTNDMLPADIIGTSIFDKEKGVFVFKQGPLFGQFVLTDELNRATSKTQSALLQVMEERRVSVDGNEYIMDEHFLIMATQNPFQQIGTYQLPESQLDRFFMGLTLGFPERSYEKKIIQQEDVRKSIQEMRPLVSPDQLTGWQKDAANVRLSDGILDYIVDLLEHGRAAFEEGGFLSPRSGRDLAMAAKACAFFDQRDYVLPEDVQEIAPAVLGHRVGALKGVRYGQEKIEIMIKTVPVPE